jgi:DNA-directed RNA polymerase subunit RPC12/RpoP
MMNQQPDRQFDDQQFEGLIHAGIASVKSGELEQARQYLEKAARLAPEDPRSWLWLSATTQDPQLQREYLESALAADPNNSAARRGLVMLSGKLEGEEILEEGQDVSAPQPADIQPAQTIETYLCPNCGGHMAFDAEGNALVCESCGFTLPSQETPSGPEAEQPLDFALPTGRAHRWAETQQQLVCERCGAISLLSPGETQTECAFCGSRSLVTGKEQGEIFEPQAIGLMRVNREAAQESLSRWLGKAWSAPDNLLKLARATTLRPAYYPFWVFSGTLELQWNCEVNLGSSKAPRWIPQSGYEFEHFDQVLVPGLKSMSEQELGDIQPFLLDDVVEFRAEYLAGWRAMTYDLPLADASLLARQIVVRKVRRELPNRVEVGREKRNLTTGATNWSGMTFKYLLLPLWTGTYTYRGRSYRILINGQTGKVIGKRPVDRIKVGAVIAGGFLVFLILVLLLIVIALSLGWLPII